jgi:hypothetical protein
MSYLVTTADQQTHHLQGIEAINVDDYSSSENTRRVITEAIAIGNYTSYTPPDPVELPPEPNPAAFRAALAQTPSWLAWAETLSPVSYTNLTIAAAQGNWGEAQAIYNSIASTTPPSTSARADWQQLANDNAIAITF